MSSTNFLSSVSCVKVAFQYFSYHNTFGCSYNFLLICLIILKYFFLLNVIKLNGHLIFTFTKRLSVNISQLELQSGSSALVV